MKPTEAAERRKFRAVIAETIASAERCQDFYYGCDGLQGCQKCLMLAARAVADIAKPK